MWQRSVDLRPARTKPSHRRREGLSEFATVQVTHDERGRWSVMIGDEPRRVFRTLRLPPSHDRRLGRSRPLRPVSALPTPLRGRARMPANGSPARLCGH